MPRTVNGSADVTITKRTGTVLTVLTNEKYCDENHAFNLSVQQGTGAANAASADVDAVTTAGSAGGTNVSDILGTKTGTEPSSGYYVRMNAQASGSSKITGAGWMDTGNLAPASAQETKYFPVAAGGVTQNAPTINTSTGVVTATVSTTEGYVPEQQTADSNTLQLTTKAAASYNVSSSDQTISSGQYLTGAQTIRGVTTENISAANIKDGVVVKVGDSDNAGRIQNVTGTFTDASTVSSGQTAASAAQILQGYSAWVDGAEIQGSLNIGTGSVTLGTPTIDSSTGVVTATVTVDEGYVQDDTDSTTLQLSTQAGTTITPTRSVQTAVAAGKYTLGAVQVGAIPNNYYTLQEVFQVGSFYSNDTGTNPAITLGFGTWQLIRSVPYRWLDVSNNTWNEIDDDTWSFEDKVTDIIYVYQRTA